MHLPPKNPLPGALSLLLVASCTREAAPPPQGPGGAPALPSAAPPAAEPAPEPAPQASASAPAKADDIPLGRALREQFKTPPRVIVAVSQGEVDVGWALLAEGEGNETPWLLVQTRDKTASYDTSFALLFEDHGARARLWDLDRDGRPDALLWEEREGKRSTAVFLTPSPGTTASGETLASSHALGFWAWSASSPEAARDALRKLAPRPIKEEEACPLLRKTRTEAGFRSVSIARAPALGFNEPIAPTLRPEPLSGSRLRDALAGEKDRCKNIRCDPRWPYCTANIQEPYSEHFWFTTERGALKLAGAAFYVGT